LEGTVTSVACLQLLYNVIIPVIEGLGDMKRTFLQQDVAHPYTAFPVLDTFYEHFTPQIILN
jgi:hypothetical protein